MYGMNAKNLATKRTAAWLATGGGAILTCLLMAAAPAAATGLSYTGHWGKGLVTPANVIVESSGCSTVTAKPSTFAVKTGIVHWSGSATTSSCPGKFSQAFTSESVVQYASALTLPVRVPNGVNTVSFVVTWNVTSFANYTLNYKGHCPVAQPSGTNFTDVDCQAQSISQVIGSSELIDLTTGTVTYPSFTSGNGAFAYSYVQNFSYCIGPSSCYYSNSSATTPWSSQSTSLNVTQNITATTNSHDKYAIFTYAGGDISQTFEVYRGTATGTVNLSTGGNGAKLISIVES
jgi:hypothetical protein